MTVKTTTSTTVATHDPLARRRLIQNFTGQAVIYTLLIIGGMLILIPFFWMVSTSLKTEDQLFIFPPRWIPDPVQFNNYWDAWEQLNSIAPGLTFWRIIGNTLFITVLAMLGEMFSAAIVAYGFARFRFKGRDTIFFIMLSTMMIPATLTMVPGFIVWREFGLLNTYDPLTLPALTAWGPLYVFLLRQFFMTIPRDMDDAAIVDGANTAQVFFYIMLPMVKPAFLAIGVLSFQGNWNNLQAPLIYLNTTQMFTLILSMQFFQQSLSKSAPKWHYMMAMATMMAAPILLLFFVAQRYFIEGLNVGAVKG
ncbi:MAG: carbohydrate ABC transporter permease [Anaerolineae bacterium]|nr:carbohydrate ABC transporter permease [Anaerolineae bacterium]